MEAGVQHGQLAAIPSLVGVPDASQTLGAAGALAAAATTAWPIAQLRLGSELERVKMQLRMVATSPALQPAICRVRYPGETALYEQQGISVPEWATLKRKGPHSSRSAPLMRQLHHQIKPEGVISKQPLKGPGARGSKGKVNAAGRVYTSKYRGVHQTFPTRRWEAQFRRSGKPTSLGCFDDEEQAAKAYDKMMLWCELHNASGIKGGITNFDPAEYEQDVTWLSSITQDELIEALRSDGRRQAAHRMLRHKSRDGSADSDMGEEQEEGQEQEDAQEQQYRRHFGQQPWQQQQQQQHGQEEGQEQHDDGQQAQYRRHFGQQPSSQQQQQGQQQQGQGPYQLPHALLPAPGMARLEAPSATLPPGLEASTAAAAAAAALARAGLIGSALARLGEQQQAQPPTQQGQPGAAQQGAMAAAAAASAAVAPAHAAAVVAVPGLQMAPAAAPAPAAIAAPLAVAAPAAVAPVPGLQEALAAVAAATAAAAAAAQGALPALPLQAAPGGASTAAAPVKWEAGLAGMQGAAASEPAAPAVQAPPSS